MAEGRVRAFAPPGLLAPHWGSSYLFIRVAAVEIPPLTLITARVAAGLALAIPGVALINTRARQPM